MTDETFADWLRKRAKAQGYEVDAARGARAALAEAAGMSASQVGRTLDGKTIPSIESQRGLAKALDVSLSEMMVRSGYAEWDDFKESERPRAADLFSATAHLGLEPEDRQTVVELVTSLARILKLTRGQGNGYSIHLQLEGVSPIETAAQQLHITDAADLLEFHAIAKRAEPNRVAFEEFRRRAAADAATAE